MSAASRNLLSPSAILVCSSEVANQIAIAVENALAYREIAELKDRLAQEKVYLEDEIRSELNFEEIVGRSPALRSVLQEIETVAPTDSTVLIYGETGTGKELIARAIHDLGLRSKANFVKLNCAAIPSGLLESEMFGHEKGALPAPSRSDWTLRAGQSRHGVFGRNWRDSPGAAAQAASRIAGAGI